MQTHPCTYTDAHKVILSIGRLRKLVLPCKDSLVCWGFQVFFIALGPFLEAATLNLAAAHWESRGAAALGSGSLLAQRSGGSASALRKRGGADKALTCLLVSEDRPRGLAAWCFPALPSISMGTEWWQPRASN